MFFFSFQKFVKILKHKFQKHSKTFKNNINALDFSEKNK